MAQPNLSSEDLAPLLALLNRKGLPSQVEAITAESPLTVVSAGAGTGKTWTLAWRFLWTALTRSDTGSMLTLTFTEKAAAEMGSRIAKLMAQVREELIQQGCKAQSPLIQRLDQCAASLDEAYISTIHGFSLRVLREAGLVLPLEPNPRLVSDPEQESFWSEVTSALDRLDNSWFAQRLSGSDKAKAEDLLEGDQTALMINDLGPQALADFARELADLLTSQGKGPQYLWEEAQSGAALEKTLKELRRAIDPKVEELCTSLAGFLSSQDLAGKTALAQSLQGLKSRWPAIPRDQRGPFLADAVNALSGAKGGLANALADSLGEPVKDWRQRAKELQPLAELLDQGWSGGERRYWSQGLKLAWLCWALWQSFKARRGLVTFADMILWAAQALEKNRNYAARFQEVMVDEFQDTDPLQDQLIQRILEASGGRLFVVGDLKQSIYRFRHAEPALLGRYAQRAQTEPGNTYVPLDVSFRSSEAILEAVNRRFSELWRTGLGRRLALPYEALRSPRSQAGAPSWIDQRQQVGLPAAERMFQLRQKETGQDGSGKLEPPSQTRKRLIEQVGLRLLELHRQGAPVWDGGYLRPMQWRDVAVLVRSRSRYEELRRGFQRLAIPVVLESTVSYYSRAEIQDCASLVQFLADPSDRLALAGLLCSPFSGLSQSRAQELLAKLGPQEPLEDLKSLEPQLAKRFQDWIRLAGHLGASSVLSRILADQDLIASIPPRRRAAATANLRQALNQLEEFQRTLGRPPQGAAGFLTKAMRGTATRQAEPQIDAGQDALRVMTIHASKGLEFPLVVLLDLDHRGRDNIAALFPSRHLLFASSRLPRQWTGQEEAPCRFTAAHRALDRVEEAEELARLYYVAQTRARDGLILGAVLSLSDLEEPTAKDGNTTRALELEFKACPLENSEMATGVPAAQERPRSEPLAPTVLHRGPDLTLPFHRRQALERISATSWSLWNFCPLAWRRSHRQGLELSWSLPDRSGGEGDQFSQGGVLLGTLVHWIMERWDFTADHFDRLLNLPESHLPAQLCPLWRSPRVQSFLRTIAGHFQEPASRELLERMREALQRRQLRREFPFRIPVDQEGCRFLLVGSVDVLWIEDHQGSPKLCLRDYKTTRKAQGAEPSPAEGLYQDQLRFYSLALRRLPQWEAGPQDAAVWNLREGTQSPLAAPTDHQEELLLQRLAQMAAQAGSGPWPAMTGRCPSCLYRQGCPGRKIP